MAGLNGSTSTLVGNLTDEVELKFGASGVAMAKFNLASSRRWKDADDKWQEKTSFFRCVAFGTLAENIAETAVKGTRMFVIGRMEQSTWEDDQGEQKTSWEFTVEEAGPSLVWATCNVVRNPRRPND